MMKNMQKRRLFVLVHGNHGHQDDMLPIKRVLESKLPGSVFLLSSANTSNTHCGVSDGGHNLTLEIISKVKSMENESDVTEKIEFSMVSHSLGGLFARACLGGVFQAIGDSLEAVSFVALNSPHLGARKPGGIKFVTRALVHGISNLFYGQTGQDLMLNNDVLGNLANDEHLERFREITLIGFAHYDLLVPFPSAVALAYNTFSPPEFSEKLHVMGCNGFVGNYLDFDISDDTVLRDVIFELPKNYCSAYIVKSDEHSKRLDNWVHSEFEARHLQSFEERLNKTHIRRLILGCGMKYSPVAHDLSLAKPDKVTRVLWDPEGSNRFIDLLGNVIRLDHS